MLQGTPQPLFVLDTTCSTEFHPTVASGHDRRPSNLIPSIRTLTAEIVIMNAIRTDTSQALRRRIVDYPSVVAAGDPEATAEYLANDFTIVYVHPARQTVTRNEWRR
jgi:hypothetical protein